MIKLHDELIKTTKKVITSATNCEKSCRKLKEKEAELKRAEKMSAKAYNLKMNTRTLNDTGGVEISRFSFLI